MRAAIVAIVVLAAAEARAGVQIAKGAVVKIEQREIYISLGDTQGVTAGASIRIKRTVRLKHPVTRAAIEDWIPVGAATVTQAAGSMSRAVVGELVQAIRVGDTAEVLIVRADDLPPAPAPPEPSRTPQKPVDPATAEVLDAFAGQSGSSVDARIAGWERYLSTHASSPFAAGVREDLEALRALRAEMQPARDGALPTETLAASNNIDHDAPRHADPGRELSLVFVLARPEEVASAYLHYRTRDARTFGRVLLARENEIYLRGNVPADAVKAPGVDYFVEVSTPGGQSALAVGSPTQPIHVDVAEPPIAAALDDRPHRTTVTVAGEYIDAAGLDRRPGDHTDDMYVATLDVSYRLDTAVQRVGIGYGSIGGRGGFRDRTFDHANPAPRAGSEYGHADVELGTRDAVVGGQLIAGVGKEGFGMGIEGHGRLGPWDGTNIGLSARTLPEIGWSTDVRFGAQPARHLLLGVSVGATTAPNDGDVAARLGTEFTYIGYDNLSLFARASWTGRSIDHGGIGGGAGFGVTW